MGFVDGVTLALALAGGMAVLGVMFLVVFLTGEVSDGTTDETDPILVNETDAVVKLAVDVTCNCLVESVGETKKQQQII